jgi:hypothetical protein
MRTKANIVEISRFEAFALHKHYKVKAENAKDNGTWSLVESYLEDAQKWLEIACEIEATDSDQVNESLVYRPF